MSVKTCESFGFSNVVLAGKLTFLPAACFSEQVHDRLDERKERHVEDDQEKTEAQGPWDSEDCHQNNPQ